MALTTAQLAILRTNILADPVLAALPNNSDGWQATVEAYALPASPTFTVWKTNVPITTIGDNLDGAELAGLTSGNISRLQCIADYSEAGVNPSLADRRKFFDDIFSGAGGAVTRPKLLVLWKRLANRAEKLYATGTGSDAVPATMTFEGLLTTSDVQQARA